MTLLAKDIWEGKLFNGDWVAASEHYDAIEVATSKPLGTVGRATGKDIETAAKAAKKAQKQWWAMSYQARAAVFERAAALAEQHQDEIIEWIIRESGSLKLKASFELGITIQALKSSSALPAQDKGTVLPSDSGKLSLARRVPLGVVGVIAPFNFPLYLSIRAVAPALALGNAVILKPDERTAVCSGVVIARLFEMAGLPKGLLHVLAGGGEVGEALTLDPNIASIQFTGSTNVGRIIGANAGKTLKKVSLELGGKNSLIVLDDADIELAAENIAWGVFLHSGQICMSSGKVLIQEGIYDAVKQRLIEKVNNMVVGDPTREDVTIAPLINESQCQRVDQLVKRAVEHGATLEVGGQADGVFFHPSVLSGVTQDNPIFSEEIFGPVAMLIPFANDQDAVALANKGEYGLSAGIITSNAGRGMTLGNHLEVGLLHINDQTVNDDTINPFGGFGASGNGTRIGGIANPDEFSQWQWVTIKAEAPHYPF